MTAPSQAGFSQDLSPPRLSAWIADLCATLPHAASPLLLWSLPQRWKLVPRRFGPRSPTARSRAPQTAPLVRPPQPRGSEGFHRGSDARNLLEMPRARGLVHKVPLTDGLFPNPY